MAKGKLVVASDRERKSAQSKANQMTDWILPRGASSLPLPQRLGLVEFNHSFC
ncbi:uncharacterized protein GLRG_00690 [Colletotrichum graminicola M1.001]|uniref:Uncharacterized protein n=1 Tax=Colletotrichum graminicola (strain M1.001 / M2 / FGSC 10212) TaxID=645133 RepID=E3Q3E4_COLGM|nr:uncharacterized protein GLRG_00690 [Colletotrichum graminicola M1.001]EFQ25546.1 hypothetical protein GLRG_00690 [Colletotrichum graminicola M1.001]